MSILPGILTLLIFGCLPLGRMLAERIGQNLGIPNGPALLGAAFVFLVLLSAIAKWLSRFIPQEEDEPHEDRLAELGTRRGQALAARLVVAAVIAGAAVILIAPGDWGSVAVLLMTLVAAVLPDAPLVRSTWPPVLPVFVPTPDSDEPDKALLPDGPRPGDEASPAADDLVSRQYAWSYQELRSSDTAQASIGHEITLRLRRAAYEAFRSRPRGSVSEAQLVHFVRDGMTDEVRLCARLIAAQAAARRLPHLEVVNFVLAFSLKAFPYASDEKTHGCREYVNYPLETLYEKACDCEDHAILAAALLLEMGFDVGLATVHEPDGGGHAALAVHASLNVDGHYLEYDGRRYYYCEATPEGDWHFGEIPPEYLRQGVRVTFFPIQPVPHAA